MEDSILPLFAADDEDLKIDGSSKSTESSEAPSVVSLFAGIGGFDLAFENAGASVKFQCEKDAFCRSVLRRHWPSVEQSNDIRALTHLKIPDADIWTAGFPCQDVSLARGSHGRTGLKGEHTSLFFELVRLASRKKPKVILLENVLGLLSSHKGADFATVISELADIGYSVSWRVVNARYFGAPQSRTRVFIVAWRNDFKKALASLYEDERGHVPETARAAFLRQHLHESSGAIVPEISYCVAATSGRHTGNDWARSYISYDDTVRRPTPTESERLQGFSSNWTLPNPELAGSRSFDSDRYKAVGNAVAVPVVSWIASRVTRLLDEKNLPSRSFVEGVFSVAPDLAPPSSHELVDRDQLQQIAEGRVSHRWKTGGILWRDRLIEANVSPAPVKALNSNFVDALDSDVPDDHYFLTVNAARGILRRADTVGRSLFQPMRKALERLIANSEERK